MGCIGIILVCYFKTLDINHKKEKTFEKLNNLSIILNQINLVERDFFEFESINPNFYKSDSSTLRKKYASLYDQLKQNIQSLNNDLLPKQKEGLKHYEELLAVKIDKHRILWDSAEYYIKLRGFKDYGLEGLMRQQIHYIEKECPLPNLEIVLMLRRHEKDYFLRKQADYILKASRVLAQLNKEIGALKIDKDKKELYLAALEKYEVYFLEIVEVENKIGVDRNSGIRSDINSQVESIEFEIQAFKNALTLLSSRQINFINWMYLVAIILLIIASFLSVLISKNLGKPTRLLIESIQKTINSGFAYDAPTFLVEGETEIASLSRNVRKMYDRIILARTKLIETQEELSTQNIKLREQSLLIEETFSMLKTKNQHLVSSIEYAKKIQEVFLPSNNKFKSIFAKSELLYQPKDLIGGDFYNVFECGDRKIIIAMDCTGHGVPGAFMTVLGATIIHRLKRMISCDDDASVILEKFDSLFRELFCSEESATHDGMDVAIVSIHKSSNELQYSGSKMPIVVQKDNEISYIKASKRGIGDLARAHLSFENVIVNLSVGDRVFLWSDGLQDQFGGDNFEKLKRKELLKTLATHADNSLSNQVSSITTLLNEWMNPKGVLTPQTDDILMIGVEV